MSDRKGSAVARFVEGVKAPFRGADFFLRHPTLTRYAIAPFLLSFVLLSVFFYSSVNYFMIPFQEWMVAKMHLTGWLLKLVEVIVWPAAILVYLILASFAFTAIANMLAGPFNERLSLRTEEIVTNKSESAVLTFRQTLGQMGRAMLMELKKVLVFVAVHVALLFLWLIPIAGAVLHTVLGLLVTLWFLATAFLDYPMERRALSYRARLYFAWTHRYEVLGFGASIAAWLMVPVVGFAAIPVSVVGGTLLYLKSLES